MRPRTRDGLGERRTRPCSARRPDEETCRRNRWLQSTYSTSATGIQSSWTTPPTNRQTRRVRCNQSCDPTQAPSRRQAGVLLCHWFLSLCPPPAPALKTQFPHSWLLREYAGVWSISGQSRRHRLCCSRRSTQRYCELPDDQESRQSLVVLFS